ncbi:ABC transporter ATP-binding protein [Halodesulfovibrio marinisediminis]|uniref:Phospholipid/cholesterol/gamma-HCH transport system ATP-binding protein n=1 Tax=Halodesulfovibrio marinisediminis DSM 17456 TaxID=1121457 RepID=A0A1N6DEE7_9BACT|nr:ATP-binding cassette domain-containing protein [Halodesulfovibrio marinisediminis]SIN69024.1 phospholipid/cholesterol/gamma-HCH transport system ATP-binding protein [Halodesulfovibrio marinisediminis DSM 17456]
MPTTTWDIELKDLWGGYNNTKILKGINGSLPAGKISVILGGSGCGKSTLLRHILGLNRPMEGSIHIGGHDFFAVDSKQFRKIRRRMGVLFQDGALLGSLTLGENVGLPLAEHTKLPQETIRKIVLHKLGLVGLADYIDYYPNELSGGMRKRAGLARAIVMDPQILLCDEPTSGLDPINAAEMDQLLLSMKEHFPAMSIVVVSHDLESLYNIADNVLVINQGQAAYCGNLEGLKSSEETYLKQLLGRQPNSVKQPTIDLGADVQAELSKWLEK